VSDDYHSKFSSRDADLVFGIDRDGTIRHISEVVGGLACECTCPACGKNLIARKGRVKVHHFGHQVSFSCATAPETALHKLAKEIVAKHRRLTIPEVVAKYREETQSFHPGQMVNFDTATEEATHLDDLIPDVYVEKEGRGLLVEIYVTHACDEMKRIDLKRSGIATIEIDLSRFPRNASRRDVEKAVTETAPRQWLYHPKIDKAVAEMQARHLDAEDAKRRKTTKDASFALKRYAGGLEDLTHRQTRPVDPNSEFSKLGFTLHIGCAVGGAGVFTTPESAWQEVILQSFIPTNDKEVPKWKLKDVFDRIRDRNLIRNGFEYVHPDVEASARELNDSFRSPYRAVEAYLDELVARGVLENVKSYWLAYPHLEALRQLRMLEKRRASRTKDIVERARWILTQIPAEERGNEDDAIDRFMDRNIDDDTGSIASMIEEDHPDYEHLIYPLSHIERMLRNGDIVATDSFGLPLYAEIERRKKTAEIERNARLAREAEQRVADLRKEAVNWGFDLVSWIEIPHPDFGGKTLIEAAAQPSGLLWVAKEALKREALKRERNKLEEERLQEAEAEKGRWKANLELEASGILGGALQPFLNSPYALGAAGQKHRPRDYCVSKETFVECIELAKAVAKLRR
jgi:hypothetical protein